MKIRRFRSIRGRATVIGLGLLMAATVTTVPVLTVSASAAVNVTVGETVVIPEGAALKLALMYGYFAQEGLNVSIVSVPGGGSANVAGLVSGSVNFISAAFASILQANTAGLNLESIAGTEDGAPQIYFVVNATLARSLGITAKTPWQTVLRDMKGQTVGVPNVHGGDGIYTTAALTAAGLPGNWITFVTIAQSAQAAAIASGQLGAVATTFPQDHQIVANQSGIVAFDMSVIPGVKHTLSTDIVTTTSYANANPTIVKEMAKGIAWGDDLLYDASTRAAALKVERYCFPGYSNKVLFDEVSTGLVKNGYQDHSYAHNTAVFSYQYGLLTSPQTTTQVSAAYTNRYLPSLALPVQLPPKRYWSFNMNKC